MKGPSETRVKAGFIVAAKEMAGTKPNVTRMDRERKRRILADFLNKTLTA